MEKNKYDPEICIFIRQENSRVNENSISGSFGSGVGSGFL
jgi:hypothetical protein